MPNSAADQGTGVTQELLQSWIQSWKQPLTEEEKEVFRLGELTDKMSLRGGQEEKPKDVVAVKRFVPKGRERADQGTRVTQELLRSWKRPLTEGENELFRLGELPERMDSRRGQEEKPKDVVAVRRFVPEGCERAAEGDEK